MRLNASIPREFTAKIKQKSDDLNLTPSNFIALCVESVLEIMDSDSPTMPYFITQYRFLKENGQLKSQIHDKKGATLKPSPKKS